MLSSRSLAFFASLDAQRVIARAGLFALLGQAELPATGTSCPCRHRPDWPVTHWTAATGAGRASCGAPRTAAATIGAVRSLSGAAGATTLAFADARSAVAPHWRLTGHSAGGGHRARCARRNGRGKARWIGGARSGPTPASAATVARCRAHAGSASGFSPPSLPIISSAAIPATATAATPAMTATGGLRRAEAARARHAGNRCRRERAGCFNGRHGRLVRRPSSRRAAGAASRNRPPRTPCWRIRGGFRAAAPGVGTVAAVEAGADAVSGEAPVTMSSCGIARANADAPVAVGGRTASGAGGGTGRVPVAVGETVRRVASRSSSSPDATPVSRVRSKGTPLDSLRRRRRARSA